MDIGRGVSSRSCCSIGGYRSTRPSAAVFSTTFVAGMPCWRTNWPPSISPRMRRGCLEDLAAQLFPGVLDDLSRTLAGNVENLPSSLVITSSSNRSGERHGRVCALVTFRSDRLVALIPRTASCATPRRARASNAKTRAAPTLHRSSQQCCRPRDRRQLGEIRRFQYRWRLFIAMAYYSGETIKKTPRGSLAVADAHVPSLWRMASRRRTKPASSIAISSRRASS